MVSVGLIERMLARGLEAEPTSSNTAGVQPRLLTTEPGRDLDATVVPAAARFVRDATEFATGTARVAQIRRPS